MALNIDGRPIRATNRRSLGGVRIVPAEGGGTGGGGGPATLPDIGPADTVAFPTSITRDAQGRVRGVVAGTQPALASQIGVANGIAGLDGNAQVPVAQLPLGVPNGIASLGGGGRIPAAQLPANAFELQGTWNAATNTPPLQSGVGTPGDVWVVLTAGTTDLDGETGWQVRDLALFTGVWERIPTQIVSGVLSVNGDIGPAVTLDLTDLPTFNLATLNARLNDGDVDFATARRQPTGAAPAGDVSGNYETGLQVTGILGNAFDSGVATPTDQDGILYDLAADEWQTTTLVTSVGDGNLTGAITSQQIRDIVGATTPLAPGITSFHTTAPVRVDPGSSLTGNSYSATYNLINVPTGAVVRLIGFPSTAPANINVIVATASVQPGANTQAFTFPSNGDFSTAGNTYTLRLEFYTSDQTPGTDNPVSTRDQSVVAQVPPRPDIFYWGTQVSAAASAVDVLTLDSSTRLTGVFTLPTWADSQHVVFATTATDPNITRIEIGGLNQLSAFTRTDNAIVVNGVNYDVYLSNNAILGSTSSGIEVTIER